MEDVEISASLKAASAEPMFFQRRLRHITAIQIRNLTPFPVRDAFATALTKPSGKAQFTPEGRLSDDLDATFTRRRGRRISTNSAITQRSLLSDEGSSLPIDNASTDRQRKTSGTKVTFSSSVGEASRSSATRHARPRTTSSSSASGSHLTTSTSPNVPASTINPVPLTPIVLDHSQSGLEKIVKARLFETFITITVPLPSQDSARSAPLQSQPGSLSPTPNLSTDKAARNPRAAKSADLNGQRRDKLQRSTSSKSPPAAGRRNSLAMQKSSSSKPAANHVKSSSTPNFKPNGRINATPSSSKGATSSMDASHPADLPHIAPDAPVYFSPIHRPSTNPIFSVDFRTGLEPTCASGHRLKVVLWGKKAGDQVAEGKGKAKAMESSDVTDAEWKKLDEWDVDLKELAPLSDDHGSHPSNLPANALLFRLSPPDQIFYLPPISVHHQRSPPASSGYTSDPESDIRRVSQVNDTSHSNDAASLETPIQPIRSSRRRHRNQDGIPELLKSSSWQDLLNLANLHSCIRDTKDSLFQVSRNIDHIVERDTLSPLHREISEREARVQAFRENHVEVISQCDALRASIKRRARLLQERKEILAAAREQYTEQANADVQAEDVLKQERTRLVSVRLRLGPTRTTLLTILSSIFPIELLSPPDLLYTILDIPLPIPLSQTDPAPPLSLPNHKEINEEVVATALGYAAQVVYLLAAYLGKTLVYPITCIGSRSLIRDGISSMVGPRMFPLFSRGVDTYRFEYGVFLLNKDIELLMADRDLRALDMRHTLPNLKNLLLTLTSGEAAHLRHIRPPDSPMSLSSDLELVSGVQDGVADHDVADNTETARESATPPQSGSITPTATTPDAKKARAFLGLYPLTDFWRGRHPSTGQSSTKSALHVSEQANSVDENDDADEEDTRTIRDGGTVSNELAVLHSDDESVKAQEKVTREAHSPSRMTFPPTITHAS